MRYAVFSGDNYHPSGGWRDLAGQCETLEEAMDIVARCLSTRDEWADIADTDACAIVMEEEVDALFAARNAAAAAKYIAEKEEAARLKVERDPKRVAELYDQLRKTREDR